MNITDYENYIIYEDGKVFSQKSKKFLKPYLGVRGYMTVNLCKYGKMKNVKIHRLVAIHHIPNPNLLEYVDHIDRCKTNNCISNLRWASMSDNNLNQTVYKNSKTGIKNISYMTRDKRYRFEKRVENKKFIKTFNTLAEAVSYKKYYYELHNLLFFN